MDLDGAVESGFAESANEAGYESFFDFVRLTKRERAYDELGVDPRLCIICVPGGVFFFSEDLL